VKGPMIKTSIAMCTFVWLLMTSIQSVAEDDRVVRQILAAWEARQQAVDRIQYVASGETTIMKGAYSDILSEFSEFAPGTEMPEHDYTYPVEIGLLIDFENGRVRLDMDRASADFERLGFYRHVTSLLHDGKNLQLFSPNSQNPRSHKGEYKGQSYHVDLVLHGSNYDRPFFETQHLPLLFGHGLTSAIDPRDGLKMSMRGGQWRAIGHAEAAGRRMVVLRSVPIGHTSIYNEYWVDVERDSAIVRWTVSSDDVPASITEIAYEARNSLWLPSEWVYRGYVGGNLDRVDRITRVLVTLEPAVSRSDFSITPSSGMVVHDRSNGDQLLVVDSGQGPPRALVDVLDEQASRRGSGVILRMLIIAAFAVVLCTVGIYYKYCRRRM
jgi:hypothetical protein